jgi:hypothetical protein
MGTLLDLASLVVVPSGYKEDKIYSVVPTDGSGDLDFTRASDATRVNSAGLIEKVRTNLLTYSEEFDNAAWGKIGSTITANATAAPDGTTTADSNIESAALDEHGVSQVCAISSGLNTISISVKANSRTRCRIGFANSSFGGMTAAQRFAYFDVSTGTVVQNISGGFSTIVSEGNGWYRCSVSQNLIAGDAAGAVQLLFIDSGVNTFYTGNGTSGLFLWGAQIETGDIATDYIPTTTAAVSVGMTADVPRLDYLGSSCPSLLLEPQRTNLVTFSEQFDNASWTKTRATITANAGTSPDGYTNADKFVEDSTNNSKFIQQSVGVADSSVYTLSVFAKAQERNQIALVSRDKNNAFLTTIFSLTAGTIVTQAHSTAKVEDYGNGWYRCSVQFNTNTGGSSVIMYLQTALNGALSYQGNGTSGLLIYGAQWELGSYVSSYIPSLSTSVTRVADACLTASVPSLIGQSEGVLFIDFNRVNSSASSWFSISNIAGTSSNAYENSVYFFQIPDSTMVAEVWTSNVKQVGFSISALSVGRHKIALGYKANDFVLYVDGVQQGTDTSGSVPTMNYLTIGGAADGGAQQMQNVNQSILFKTRLSNTELAQLTTI